MRRIRWRLRRIDLRSRMAWRVRRLQQLAFRNLYRVTGRVAFADIGLSPYTAAILSAVATLPADLYIAHYPAALPAAAAMALRWGTRFAYDAEDYHLGEWADSPTHAVDRRLLRAIEGRYLPKAAYVTAASPGIADAYVETYGLTRRPTVLLNVFPLSQGPRCATSAGTAQPGPSLYWFSQTIGPERGLECAIAAIGRARTRPHLYLRGTLAAGFAGAVTSLTERAGAVGRVHFLEPAAPDDMERLAVAYDAGLIAENGGTALRRLCLTNKLFSYMAAGIAPLMSDIPAHRALAMEAGLEDLLYPVNNADALAELIDRIISQPDRLARVRAKAWHLAQDRYNWDREQTTLLELVSQSLNSTGKTHEIPFNRIA